MKVLVAMSGGVDSSAAALLLQRAGHTCGGAMLRLHGAARSDEDDARAVAEKLRMPFFVFDESERFARCVKDVFVAAYCAGETPNPCVLCNRTLKFGAFLERALAMGYDAIATGHYAAVRQDAAGRYHLHCGRTGKDQGYVLYQLTQYHLSHLLLPVGAYSKTEIRTLAEEAGLPVAQKADSQDICFIPDGDYVNFLCEYGGVALKSGDFVDAQGRVLGRHRGLVCYTTGQRKGLGISAEKPLYVLAKDMERNEVLLGDNEELFAASLLARDVNWLDGARHEQVQRVQAKVRYSQRSAAATVTPQDDGSARVDFDVPQRAITAGQAVVFYEGDEVLGGGSIVGALDRKPLSAR